jgi:hypothetical protein
MTYARFGAMMAASVLVMYALMYLNTYSLDHVWFSQTRARRALMMGAAMATLMLAFMLKMYPDKRMNLAIFAVSAIVFAAALWFSRSQQTVGDVDYMKGMIPHHSVAILTSERARIRDQRVRRLADTIIASQEREIAEMKDLIADLKRNRVASIAPLLPPAQASVSPACNQ